MVWTIEPFAPESCDTLDTVCRENTAAQEARALISLREMGSARRDGPKRGLHQWPVIQLWATEQLFGGLLKSLQQAKAGCTFDRRVAAMDLTVGRPCGILDQ